MRFAPDCGTTEFAWIDELTADLPTIGMALRQRALHTAFKASGTCPMCRMVRMGWSAGFADYQQWGDMFGRRSREHQADGTIAFETIDWLEHQGTRLDQPWLLVCSLINLTTLCSSNRIRWKHRTQTVP